MKDARSEDARRNIGSKEPHQVRERDGKKRLMVERTINGER